MPKINISITSDIIRSARVKQLEGIFDVPPTKSSSQSWSFNFPIDDFDWNIGLIVGPSGSGKSTVARKAFGEKIVDQYHWKAGYSIVDSFPSSLSIKEITSQLSSVGFSSPPSWLRSFNNLSNGEQFRVTLARAICENSDLFVMDEFTSVVDRTVAQIGSHAVAKSIRKQNKKFVAVSCHYDIIDWLDPDWVLEMPNGDFSRRLLRRVKPEISLEIIRVSTKTWELFKKYHYLNTSIHKAAYCFVALYRGRPVAFTSVLIFCHPTSSGWKEHRTVCLPDFQGVGIGNVLSEFVAGMFKATGKKYRSVTSSPSMIYHRHRSKLWQMIREPSLMNQHSAKHLRKTSSAKRMTASFLYVGPSDLESAKKFGILK